MRGWQTCGAAWWAGVWWVLSVGGVGQEARVSVRAGPHPWRAQARSRPHRQLTALGAHLHTGPYFSLNCSMATCRPSKKMVDTSHSDCRLNGGGPGTTPALASPANRRSRSAAAPCSCFCSAAKGQPDADASPSDNDTSPARVVEMCAATDLRGGARAGAHAARAAATALSCGLLAGCLSAEPPSTQDRMLHDTAEHAQ
jgi:hypothetical protein